MSNSSVGARSYGGKRRHGLAWIPWLAFLLLLLLAVGIYFLVHQLNKPDHDASSSTPPVAATASPISGASGVGIGGLIGGGGVATSVSNGSSGASASTAGVAGTVLFAPNSAALDVPANTVINNAAQILKANGTKQVTVTGYTDVVGNEPINGSLSQERADSVAAALRSDLSPDVTVTTGAKGEQDPVASNTNADGSDNRAGRQQNRRAVIAAS